jgi:phage/plasmid-associated DNA primase
MNEPDIKELTGNDSLYSRSLHETPHKTPIYFQPQLLFIGSTIINEDEIGIRRRIKTIPFDSFFVSFHPVSK